MNRDRDPIRDESDDALDRLIRAATTQLPPIEVRQRAIDRAAALTPGSQALRRRGRGRSWFLAAAAVAPVAAACVMVFLMPAPSSFGWEDVTKAVQSRPWIRATTSWEGKKSTMWLSPRGQVWAFRTYNWDNNWFIFADGRQQARYEYRAKDQRITKAFLGEEGQRLVAPVDYVSQGLWLFGTERVVSQRRREVTEAGKKWVEFDLVFWRGDMNLGTLRVDPETRLPVYLLLRSRTDETKSVRYDFTYPDDGPADVYALGVPAGTKIDDRMPPKDAQRALDAIAAGRGRIGDFRLVVATTQEQAPVQRQSGFIVWRKGDRWRIDTVAPVARLHGAAKPPEGLDLGDPLVKQLQLAWLGRLYLCDGRTVYRNANPPRLFEPERQDSKSVTWEPAGHIAPRDLLSGEGFGAMQLAFHARIASLVYPDLSPVQGWSFEFDPRPADAPGCVLIKRSARLATKEPAVGHEWHYLDPAKGYAVVRAELFNLPAAVPADLKADTPRETVRLEEYQKTPQGFWYPAVIHFSRPVTAAADGKAGREDRPSNRTETVRYHFDFGVALPDSLFATEDASKSGK
jgi:hypothetical protein